MSGEPKHPKELYIFSPKEGFASSEAFLFSFPTAFKRQRQQISASALSPVCTPYHGGKIVKYAVLFVKCTSRHARAYHLVTKGLCFRLNTKNGRKVIQIEKPAKLSKHKTQGSETPACKPLPSIATSKKIACLSEICVFVLLFLCHSFVIQG